MKKFFEEFKKFITRGNVVDMSVGVIVGGAFTAIVNGLSNNILKPLVNMALYLVLGKGSLENIYWVLHPVYMVDATNGGYVIDPITGKEMLDLTQSIYVDWGSFINAIINFFIIAFVLFVIVKIINTIKENQDKLTTNLKKSKLSKEQINELRENGIKIHNKKAVNAYFEEKQRIADEKAVEEAKAAEEAAKEAARLEREANPTTEDLLKLILAELKKS